MQIILYSRPGCHLCDDLKADLVELEHAFTFILVERNIEDAAADMMRFQYLIPVLDIEGGPTLYPPHDWLSLTNALRAAAGDTT